MSNHENPIIKQINVNGITYDVCDDNAETNIATNATAIADAKASIETIESTSLFIDINGKFYVNMESE